MKARNKKPIYIIALLPLFLCYLGMMGFAQKNSTYSWTGSVDHPGIEACGCDTLDLMDATYKRKDSKGNDYGQVLLCNDSLYAYVQVYLGRGRQMNDVWLWTGTPGKVPTSGGVAARTKFNKFLVGYRNSYTLKAPLTSVLWRHDVSLILRTYLFDGFTNTEPTDEKELFIAGKFKRGTSAYTRQIDNCCGGEVALPSGNAYHYLAPAICGEVATQRLLSQDKTDLGSVQIYTTTDSLMLIFDVKRGHMVGNIYFWQGDKASPNGRSGPLLDQFPIKVNPWRQNFIMKIPGNYPLRLCKVIQVYAEVHEINLTSQSVKKYLTQPEGFTVDGWEYCPPECCYEPVTK